MYVKITVILMFLKDYSDLSDISVSTPIAVRSKQLPHFKISSSDENESDSSSKKKVNGTKR